jgi:hypothetical protein
VADSAFKLYAAEHPNLPRTLRASLEKRRAELIAQLTSAQSWDDFKERRGRILGVEEAISECAETEKQMER